MRASDLGRDGQVRDVVLLEYFQEARVRYFMDLHTRGQEWGHHVVAQTDLRVLGPLPPTGSYAVTSWVGRLGTRSFTVGSQLTRDDTVVAEADVVMVTFDRETQRPAPMADSQRERLEVELAG